MISPINPVDICLEGFVGAVGANGVDRSGDVIGEGAAVTEAEAVLVAGILKLILFFLGE